MPRPRSDRRSIWRAVVLAAVLLLPVLYVLSIAPAALLVRADWISFDTWSKGYKPLKWTTNQVPATKKIVYSYMNAWGALPVMGHDDDGEFAAMICW